MISVMVAEDSLEQNTNDVLVISYNYFNKR